MVRIYLGGIYRYYILAMYIVAILTAIPWLGLAVYAGASLS